MHSCVSSGSSLKLPGVTSPNCCAHSWSSMLVDSPAGPSSTCTNVIRHIASACPKVQIKLSWSVWFFSLAQSELQQTLGHCDSKERRSAVSIIYECPCIRAECASELAEVSATQHRAIVPWPCSLEASRTGRQWGSGVVSAR